MSVRSRPSGPSRTSARARRAKRRTAAEDAALDPIAVDDTAAGRRMSLRTLVVLGLLVVLGTMFLPSINTGIKQLQQITALQSDIDSTEEEVEALRAKREQLDDPEYIKRVAREEQHYAMPGEEVFIVIDDTEDDGTEVAGDRVERPVRSQPWYVELVDSLRSVGYATQEGS